MLDRTTPKEKLLKLLLQKLLVLKFNVDVALVMVPFLWILGKDFVVYDHVSLENVQLMRPPTQGKGLVGILDDLGFGAKLWQNDVFSK